MQPSMMAHHSIPMLAPPVAPPPSVTSVPRGMHGCLQATSPGLQAPSPDSVPQAVFPSSMGELNPDAPSFVPQYYQGNAAQSAGSALPDSDPAGQMRQIEELDALISASGKHGLGKVAAARAPPVLPTTVPTPPGLAGRQMPPNMGIHPDRSMMPDRAMMPDRTMMQDRSMMFPPNHYPRLPAQGPPPPTQAVQAAPPPAQPSPAVQPSPSAQQSPSSSAGGVRLFEDRWSAETVPENLKELWIPPQQQPVVSHHNMYATAPPAQPPNFVARQHPTPSNVFPVELNSPGNPGIDAMKNIRTPSTAVPDSPPFLSSPTPYRTYQPNLANPPAPAHEPSIDLGLATRTLLLKYRTSLGRFSAPWELKMKYKLVDGREIQEVEEEEDPEESQEANPTAGATLLKYVKGEASMSDVVGKARGEELMQFLKGPESPSGAQPKENADLNIFNKLTALPSEPAKPEPEHKVWALNKILTTKLPPTEDDRWNQSQQSHIEWRSWEQSNDENHWNWDVGRRRQIKQESWQAWNSDDSWTEHGDNNAWSWDGREKLKNRLPEGWKKELYPRIGAQKLKPNGQIWWPTYQTT